MTYDVIISGMIGAENKLPPIVLCDGEKIRVKIEDAMPGTLMIAENEHKRASFRLTDGEAILPSEFSRTSHLVLTLAVFDGGVCVHEMPVPPIVVVKADGATALRDWVADTERRLSDIEAAVFGQTFSFME